MSFKVKLARTGSGIGMWDRKEHLGVLLLGSFLALGPGPFCSCFSCALLG